MIDVRVQAGEFDAGRQLQRLGELEKAAVVSFVGILEAGEEVAGITIEHYAALAKGELARIAQEAEQRWNLPGVILIHRHGSLKPGSPVLFAAAAASEPAVASEACAYLVEAVRKRAPFWRREMLADGSERWR